jgi:hypothetical protein
LGDGKHLDPENAELLAERLFQWEEGKKNENEDRRARDDDLKQNNSCETREEERERL